MLKCVIKKGSSNLSGFYPNDIPGVFAFRKNDWMSFSNRKEAKNKLDYIKKEVSDKLNQERWGTNFTNKHLNTLKKLKIDCGNE